MDWTKISLKEGVAYSLLVLAVALLVVNGANAAIMAIDIEKVDPAWRGITYAFKAFFRDGNMVLFLTWSTNAVGLIIVYAKMKALGVKDFTYNVWKYYGTLAMVMGIGATALMTLPEPYGKTALIVSAIIKLLETSISKVTPSEPNAASATAS